MLPLPLHIATRGRLDGEYGIATRGYIICPDIVPRFPFDAEIADLDINQLLGISDPDRLEAFVEDHPDLTLFAKINGPSRRYALVAKVEDAEAFTLEALVEDAPFELEAEVSVVEADQLGTVEEVDLGAAVVSGDDIGLVTEEDDKASVDQADLVATVDDEPPRC